MDQETTSSKTYTRSCRCVSSEWTKKMLQARQIHEHANMSVVNGPRNYFKQDKYMSTQICQ